MELGVLNELERKTRCGQEFKKFMFPDPLVEDHWFIRGSLGLVT